MDNKHRPGMDINTVMKVNSCLHLQRLAIILTTEEWNRFIQLLNDGQLVFSGDPSGFHLKSGPNSCWDCASEETSQVLPHPDAKTDEIPR